MAWNFHPGVEMLREDTAKGCKKRRQNLEFQREWGYLCRVSSAEEMGTSNSGLEQVKRGSLSLNFVQNKNCTSRNRQKWLGMAKHTNICWGFWGCPRA